VRQQIARQLGAEIDDPVVDAALAKATSQLKIDSAADSTPRSALRHEIGHALLIKAFWADQSATGSSVHYGGPAPDWLDEVGAVLMEDATMADGRREQLLRMRDAADNAALKPLAEFFAMAHPIKAQAGELAKLRRGNTDGTSVHVVSGDQAQQLAAQAGGFYAQARGVADFLLAESGEPSIFGDIARTVAEGSTIEQWLASRGDRFGLPDSLPGLQERWSAWLAALPDR
jgi:hypothetical protein